jgi:uncharacterized protein (DUF1800 family)
MAFGARSLLRAASIGAAALCSAIVDAPAGAQTLYLATLTSQCAGAVLGSGNASLVLSADQARWDVRFQFTNLTGTITSKHVHAGDGQILHDLDATPPSSAGVYVWTIAQAGSHSPAAIRSGLEQGALYLNLHTGVCPNGEIKGVFKAASGGQTFTPPPAAPALPNTWNRADAARFLVQTTYGPKWTEVEALHGQLQARGAAAFDDWLTKQFAEPAVPHLAALDQLRRRLGLDVDEVYPDHVMESVWSRAVFGSDQLRQRVALALSEIFVVSDVDDEVWGAPEGMASYLDVLERDAFKSYRKLLEDVTLSPTMGVYLDMLSNDKADPETGAQPNENFAREILQLFSIGLYQLHPDGSLKLDATGLPIPTYGQAEIEGLAAVFTGWTHAGQNKNEDWRFYWPEPRFRVPMKPWERHHERGPKQLLDGVVQPGGRGSVGDLKAALDQIAAHPNVGPFLCKQLIQRLVTSNPSPAYVYRCAQVFAADATGKRGNLQSVVRAILLDYEARSPEAARQVGYGKLREPIVKFGGLLRSLQATTSVGDGRLRYYWLDSPEWGLGQNPLRAPTVFNFFEPTYAQSGDVASAGLVSPEFKIATETTVLANPNFLRGVVFEGWMYDDPDTTAEERLSFPWATWTALDNQQLLARIDALFFAGSMSAATREILRTALVDPDFVWPPNDRTAKVKELIWLTFLSPESLIQK